MKLTKKHILIVDDVKTNVLLLQNLLEEQGHEFIYTATSALEAYKILEHNKIDLILLDVVMPLIDGIEACKTIRENKKYSKIPIIMITADNSDTTLALSFQAGANEYITKPINITTLKIRIENIFSNIEKDLIIFNQTKQIALKEAIETLAHQWRQPLATIGSSVTSLMLKSDLDKLNKETIKSSLGNISEYIQKLSKSIDEFAMLSKSSTQNKVCDINELITKSLYHINYKLMTNNIKIIKDFSVLSQIKCFEYELMNVFINIIQNSIDAFKTIDNKSDKYIHITTKQTDTSIVVTITDNAGGIEKYLLREIFNAYYSTKEEKNGVGLGLYNANNILKEYMNATIKVDSQDERTIVTICLPTLI